MFTLRCLSWPQFLDDMEQDLPIVLFEIKVIKLKLRAFYTLLDRFIIYLIITDGYYSQLSLFSRPKQPSSIIVLSLWAARLKAYISSLSLEDNRLHLSYDLQRIKAYSIVNTSHHLTATTLKKLVIKILCKNHSLEDQRCRSVLFTKCSLGPDHLLTVSAL